MLSHVKCQVELLPCQRIKNGSVKLLASCIATLSHDKGCFQLKMWFRQKSLSKVMGFGPDKEPSVSSGCQLFIPGHRTHLVQINHMFRKEKFKAAIELESPTSIRLFYSHLEQIFFHHRATEVYLQYLAKLDLGVSFSPESQLLWFHGSKPVEISPAYLSEGPIEPCVPSEVDTGFYRKIPGQDS